MVTQTALSTDEINDYLEVLWLERGLAENTLAAYRRDLTYTAQVLAKAQVNSLLQAQQHDLLQVLDQRQQKNSVPGARPAG